MKYFSTLFVLLTTSFVNAQNYSAADIPFQLKEYANAVKRMEEFHVTIKALDKVVVKHHYVITVLNEQGDKYAEYHSNFSSWEEITDISGSLYDASGKKIRSAKRKDFEDLPVTDGFSLVLDAKFKRHNFYQRQYPYTIEYEEEKNIKGSYFLPSWYPVPDEGYSVEQSLYTVEVPTDYKLRYKQWHLSAPVISPNNPFTSYVWELKNFRAIRNEGMGPSFTSLEPVVNIGPGDFSFGKYTGNMSTWLDFGKFNVALNKDRDELPENVKQDVHRLVDNITNREEKIKVLYEYLQKNTRYISVQLGIGGWQPFDAKYVAANKYGDCKALSNYMVSLLKEAGIKANYVLVSAGKTYRKLQEDFPAQAFNHVITCVPNGKDSIWLECTSQTKSPGFMGSFTGDRKALLIDDDGGHIVNTPFYSAEDNLQLRSIAATIDAEGNLSAEVNTHLTGIQQEQQHLLLHGATKDQREKYLNAVLNLPTYKVNISNYKETRDKLPAIDEYLQVTAPVYAIVSDKRLIIEPDLFTKSNTQLQAEVQRRRPIEFTAAYKYVDSIRISLPPGYAVETLPGNVTINTSFGRYTISYKIGENRIDVVRTEVRNKATLPASKYADVVAYYETLYKADRNRIVFVKKQG